MSPPDAVVACFTKDGTYCSPDTYPGIGREALANFVKGVWTAFPDFSVELLNAGEIHPGIVALRWLARGTNIGPGADGSKPYLQRIDFFKQIGLELPEPGTRRDASGCPGGGRERARLISHR
jgi:hypothetical protein